MQRRADPPRIASREKAPALAYRQRHGTTLAAASLSSAIHDSRSDPACAKRSCAEERGATRSDRSFHSCPHRRCRRNRLQTVTRSAILKSLRNASSSAWHFMSRGFDFGSLHRKQQGRVLDEPIYVGPNVVTPGHAPRARHACRPPSACRAVNLWTPLKQLKRAKRWTGHPSDVGHVRLRLAAQAIVGDRSLGPYTSRFKSMSAHPHQGRPDRCVCHRVRWCTQTCD